MQARSLNDELIAHTENCVLVFQNVKAGTAGIPELAVLKDSNHMLINKILAELPLRNECNEQLQELYAYQQIIDSHIDKLNKPNTSVRYTM